MRADQLRSAAGTIAELLKKSDLLNSIRQHRDAREERQRQGTRTRLSQSAKMLIAGSRGFSEAEKSVSGLLHLDKLSSVDYWQALVSADGDQRAQHAELVQLYSRVMFASSHLPSLLNMVSDVRSAPAAIDRSPGENTLILRLNDAGEKASDPDRVARAIDGIDMIYAASVSLSRRPAIDLQLREISGHPEKLLVFLGDEQGISALCTILESIPEALDSYHDDEELDVAKVVGSLPIFHDLATLSETANYSDLELRDIGDTMHQGVMLALESGVVVHDMPPPVDPENGVTTLNKRADSQHPHQVDQTRGFATEAQARYGDDNQEIEHYRDRDPALHRGMNGSAHPAQEQGYAGPDHHAPAEYASELVSNDGGTTQGSENNDEYYQHYLEERERLRDGTEVPDIDNMVDDLGADDRLQARPQRKNRKDKGSSLTGLFKGLSRSRNK